ncbi:MAG: phosphatase PAP2 family protein [Erysipelotrichaceae bacterium]|nr:phosphatase PAP2 family protein [Erysipelotrichaceae bacterium]
MMGTTFQFACEVVLIEWLQNNLMTNQFILAFLSFVTNFGDATVIALFVGFIYLVYDKKLGMFAAINIICAEALNSMAKNVFLRRRPYFDNEGIESLTVVEDEYDVYDIQGQGFSFPSGHSACGGAITASMYRYTGKKTVLWIMMVIYSLVMLSRMALGVHYPTDVLTGFLLGISVSYLIPFLVDKLGKVKAYILIMLVCGLGFFFCRSNDYYSSYGLFCGFCLIDLFEERYVNFENTRNPLRAILRMLMAAGLFLAVVESLKLPFSIEFLESGTTLAYLLRWFRYFLASFISMGLYPMIFRYDLLGFEKREKGKTCR